MLILRIRQAEVSLADGRLDEALALVDEPAVRQHRRGQALVSQLAAALVQRGQSHLSAGRLEEARLDAEKAVRLAGSAPAVAELRLAVAEALRQLRQQGQARQTVLAEARGHIQQDRLSLGEQLLNNLDTSAAAPLKDELHRRRQAIEAAAGSIEEALARKDWATAVERLAQARRRGLTGAGLDEAAARLRRLVLAKLTEAFAAGRLDVVETMLSRLAGADGDAPELRPWRRASEQCRRAGRALRAGRAAQAGQILRRLRTAMPEMTWLADAVNRCDRAASELQELCTGPLGLMESIGGADMQTGEQDDADAGGLSDLPTAGAGAAAESPTPADAAPLPERLLIRADGVGSFLVLRQARVTLGPISSSARPDVGLLIDPATPSATVERVEEDYFLRAGDEPGKLLGDGDRIALSARCRLRFTRPNAASTSAVLDLSAGRLGQADTRKVILMDREILLGRGPAAHLRADELAEPAVLHVRDGQLACRTTLPVTANGAPCSAALPLGVPVRIGSLSLVIESA